MNPIVLPVVLVSMGNSTMFSPQNEDGYVQKSAEKFTS